ncbi:uncharacterized protein LOC141767463 isoform X2 [Sebastes fasciatus]|uniref:uncharacterized protein LOC141767463 isoform X2 n=1 Tax=Sebastes fasciatus TaxID=394691 RepID=UPI003D9EDF27
MAGLGGLKVLLLWAGIIVMAKSPPPPQCSYNVTPIKFGFLIDMIMNSTTGDYTITLNEEGQAKSIYNFNQSRHVIEHLKPCTEYEHSVLFIDGAGKATPCNGTENETMTSGMSKDDIKDVSCMPGYVCYQSDWNISSSLSASNNVPAEPCKTDNKMFCIKPGFDDICTDLTTTFRSDCTASFDVTKSITVDFLNASEITQIAPTELPAQIDTELPPNCTDLTVDYTCQEDGKPSNTKKLSELEPFTDYSCTGQIKENNVTKKNTNAVKFRIDYITIIYTKQSATNTDKSIELSWITISQNCPGLPDLEKFSYDCSCLSSSHQSPIVPANKERSGGTCQIAGLKPFTDYTCKVQPKYNDMNVHQPTEVKQRTKAGTPEDIHDLTVIVVDHNVIRVKCVYKGSFNGPKVTLRFIARLHNAGVTKELKNKTCDFDFKDLSYLTEYNLEVTAYNGEHESKPKKKDGVTTSYNDKAVIGLLVFLIILTSVALLLVIYKIYILKRRNSK